MKLQVIGKLYFEHLDSLKTASCTTQLTYSLLTSLSETNFAKEHKEIILSTTKISEYMDGLLSSRMIRHQLNLFKEDKKLSSLLKENHRNNLCHLKLKKPTENKFFFVIVPYENRDQFSPSSIMLLSLLLNKAAFNYRAGNGFTVTASQMQNLDKELGVCAKSIKNSLKIFLELNLVKDILGNSEFSVSDLLSRGFKFCNAILQSYSELISLKLSEKCKNIDRKKQYKVSQNRVTRDKEFRTQIINSVNKNKAEQPSFIAESWSNNKAHEKTQFAQGWEQKYAMKNLSLIRSIYEAWKDKRPPIPHLQNTCLQTLQQPNCQLKNQSEIFGHRSGNFWSSDNNFSEIFGHPYIDRKKDQLKNN